MNRSRLLNAGLAQAVASLGHGNLMIVCNAGFPIPPSAWCIDLAVIPDVPDRETDLSVVAEAFAPNDYATKMKH